MHQHAKYQSNWTKIATKFPPKLICVYDGRRTQHECNSLLVYRPSGLKSGISAFKMAARRPSWIGPTQFFVYRWALRGYILIPNLACLPYPIMKISHQNDSVYDDDGRKVNAIARWSFGPSGLKIGLARTAILPT